MEGHSDKNVPLSLSEQEDTVERFWDNPENVLRLIDLIFLYDDNNKLPPS